MSMTLKEAAYLLISDGSIDHDRPARAKAMTALLAARRSPGAMGAALKENWPAISAAVDKSRSRPPRVTEALAVVASATGLMLTPAASLPRAPVPITVTAKSPPPPSKVTAAKPQPTPAEVEANETARIVGILQASGARGFQRHETSMVTPGHMTAEDRETDRIIAMLASSGVPGFRSGEDRDAG